MIIYFYWVKICISILFYINVLIRQIVAMVIFKIRKPTCLRIKIIFYNIFTSALSVLHYIGPYFFYIKTALLRFIYNICNLFLDAMQGCLWRIIA